MDKRKILKFIVYMLLGFGGYGLWWVIVFIFAISCWGSNYNSPGGICEDHYLKGVVAISALIIALFYIIGRKLFKFRHIEVIISTTILLTIFISIHLSIFVYEKYTHNNKSYRARYAYDYVKIENKPIIDFSESVNLSGQLVGYGLTVSYPFRVDDSLEPEVIDLLIPEENKFLPIVEKKLYTDNDYHNCIIDNSYSKDWTITKTPEDILFFNINNEFIGVDTYSYPISYLSRDKTYYLSGRIFINENEETSGECILPNNTKDNLEDWSDVNIEIEKPPINIFEWFE